MSVLVVRGRILEINMEIKILCWWVVSWWRMVGKYKVEKKEEEKLEKELKDLFVGIMEIKEC